VGLELPESTAAFTRLIVPASKPEKAAVSTTDFLETFISGSPCSKSTESPSLGSDPAHISGVMAVLFQYERCFPNGFCLLERWMHLVKIRPCCSLHFRDTPGLRDAASTSEYSSVLELTRKNVAAGLTRELVQEGF
jgi:hypothetical protein